MPRSRSSRRSRHCFPSFEFFRRREQSCAKPRRSLVIITSRPSATTTALHALLKSYAQLPRNLAKGVRESDGGNHYPVATFNFQKTPRGTKLTFTKIGIPPHRYSGHYRGWIETYWTPMQEMLRDGHELRQP